MRPDDPAPREPASAPARPTPAVAPAPQGRDIVIAGGGAGGLELAARLGRGLRGRARVLLIDRSPFHLWKPSLHEVAAGSLDSHHEGAPYPLLARRNGFSFVLGEVDALDPQARALTLKAVVDDDGDVAAPARTLRFDALVLALGSGSNLFDTPGAAEHASLLENVGDAEAFHRKLTIALLAAAGTPTRRLRIAIVGAGATGVELSTELLEGHAELQEALPEEQRFALKITLIEAAPRILGGLSDRVAEKATRVLEARGIVVLTDAKVERVRRDAVETTQGEIQADLVVWAAGVKAAETHRAFGLATNALNQFVVDDRLATSAPNIYALGDCAQAPGPGGRPVPARAQAASQQAAYLARRWLRPDRDPGPYRYRDRGSLISLGEGHGVGALMGGLAGRNFLVEGLLAKWAYVGLHLDHHRAVLGVRRTVLLALARLLTRRASGRLKLH